MEIIIQSLDVSPATKSLTAQLVTVTAAPVRLLYYNEQNNGRTVC